MSPRTARRDADLVEDYVSARWPNANAMSRRNRIRYWRRVLEVCNDRARAQLRATLSSVVRERRSA